MPDRDDKGRFIKGHSGGPGRPPREREEKYYQITMQTCTFDQWKKIVQRAVKDALRGDAKARDWLSGYLVGVPEQPIGGMLEVVLRYVDQTTDNHD